MRAEANNINRVDFPLCCLLSSFLSPKSSLIWFWWILFFVFGVFFFFHLWLFIVSPIFVQIVWQIDLSRSKDDSRSMMITIIIRHVRHWIMNNTFDKQLIKEKTKTSWERKKKKTDKMRRAHAAAHSFKSNYFYFRWVWYASTRSLHLDRFG